MMAYSDHSAPPPFRRPTPARFLATFGLVWMVVGLFTGTLVLVILVRWLIGLLRHFGFGQTAESRVLIGVILLFVLGSFLLARALVRRLFRMQTATARRLALASLVLPFGVSAYVWSDPGRTLAAIAGSSETKVAMSGGPEFIFGAYPDYQKLQQLKREGITSVVSLQHPGVVVELQGIRAEREAARQLGIHLIQAPMLPWISDNEASLALIRQIALKGHGRYYVHCGLGRDRVNVAKRLIESLQGESRVRSTADLKDALGFANRARPFERGVPQRLAPDVWVVPYLNASEFFGYILQGRAGHVILALDTTVAAQRAWLMQAERQMRSYMVPFEVFPVREAGREQLDALASRIRALKAPVTVMVGYTPFTLTDRGPRTAVARALLDRFGAPVRDTVEAAKADDPLLREEAGEGRPRR
ncbi:MAG: protein-tyrosine phosphatase family protein [Gemmatimonadaceae bacterium]